jgi:hypothetical protein
MEAAWRASTRAAWDSRKGPQAHAMNLRPATAKSQSANYYLDPSKGTTLVVAASIRLLSSE